MSWEVRDLKLWAKIGDEEYEILSCEQNFSLSTIPGCMVSVPLGIDVVDRQVAKIHETVNKLKEILPIKVYMKTKLVSKFEGPDSVLPEAETVIFDGDVIGTGYDRSYDRVQFNIHATHWLARLDYSSMLSVNSHPSNPADFTYAPVHATYGNSGEVVGDKQTPGYVLNNSFKDDAGLAVDTDLWEKGILPFFQDLAKQNLVNSSVLETKDQKNDLATAALERFKKGNDGCNKRLRMRFEDSRALPIKQAIVNFMIDAGLTSLGQSTFWSKLVNDYSGPFHFRIVPRVQDAMVVPFVPALRDTFKEIKGTEYGDVSWRRPNHRLLRGVALLTQNLSRVSHIDPSAPGGAEASKAGMIDVGGHFSPKGRETGMMIFTHEPGWMSRLSLDYGAGPITAGVGGDGQAIKFPNAMAPGGAEAAANNPTKKDTARAAKPILDALAQNIYVEQALYGRTAQISGRLRFDISPGSSIKLANINSSFLNKGEDNLGAAAFATVMGVTNIISAERAVAGTTFQLAYLRTAEENSDDAYSVAQHPIWEDVFLGCKLID